jgi:hypothetical protein
LSQKPPPLLLQSPTHRPIQTHPPSSKRSALAFLLQDVARRSISAAGLPAAIERQAAAAVEEADALVLVMDGQVCTASVVVLHPRLHNRARLAIKLDSAHLLYAPRYWLVLTLPKLPPTRSF